MIPPKKKHKNPSMNNIEKKIYDLLISLNVEFETQVSLDKYSVDFLVEKKYIIECYGDFWHCNPSKYAEDYFNRGKKKSAREIWDRDALRKKEFEALGYKFLYFWETEINTDIKSVRAAIQRYIK